MEALLSIIERTLDEVLPRPDERPSGLSEAMRYAVGSGGKRIRPLLCLLSATVAGGTPEDARYPAAAVELLHNYTLVHDDLPAMDDDTERRGRPTVWAKFGEANAILVGDALQALAFRTAAKAPRNVAAIVDILGEKGVGVVQGQVEDVSSFKFQVSSSQPETTSLKPETTSLKPETLPLKPETNPLKPETDDFIYRHKTADLFIAAAAMGGLAGGGSDADVAALREFALNLGLAFQYEDDLLDGDGIYPPAETERLVHETTAAAVAALGRLPGDATFLRDLAQKLIGRKV